MLGGGVAVAACALLLAACGSTPAPTAGAPATSTPASGASATGATGSSSAGQAAPAAISLDVTFAASANVPATHYTLHCEPASGTVADPAAACTKLLTGTSLFAPRPAHELCPMIMLGAGRATVTGTYLGQNVHETIVDGGCDLSRWAKLKAVFT
jgi:Subtilisin inhibitor-like